MKITFKDGRVIEALCAQRGQRAGGASKFDNQHALTQLRQALLVAIEHRQPYRGLVAELTGRACCR